MRMPKGWSQHTRGGWWMVIDDKGLLRAVVAVEAQQRRIGG